MPAVEVRPARPEEYAEAGAVVVAAYRALPGTALTGSYAAELADVAGRVAGAEVLVAADGTALLGCVTFVLDPSSPLAGHLRPDEAAIRMLGVDPAAQGRGVGAALVEACVTRARAAGRAAVFLHSTPWMAAAHRVYERAGFQRTPDRDRQPVPEVPLLAFRLALVGSGPAGEGTSGA